MPRPNPLSARRHEHSPWSLSTCERYKAEKYADPNAIGDGPTAYLSTHGGMNMVARSWLFSLEAFCLAAVLGCGRENDGPADVGDTSEDGTSGDEVDSESGSSEDDETQGSDEDGSEEIECGDPIEGDPEVACALASTQEECESVTHPGWSTAIPPGWCTWETWANVSVEGGTTCHLGEVTHRCTFQPCGEEGCDSAGFNCGDGRGIQAVVEEGPGEIRVGTAEWCWPPADPDDANMDGITAVGCTGEDDPPECACACEL